MTEKVPWTHFKDQVHYFSMYLKHFLEWRWTKFGLGFGCAGKSFLARIVHDRKVFSLSRSVTTRKRWARLKT